MFDTSGGQPQGGLVVDVAVSMPARRSRAMDVADYVTEAIASRKLRPGDRVGTAMELQTSLGVAKSTVAEAVKILVDRGQVVAKTGPNGGVFVADAEGHPSLKRYFVALVDDVATLEGALTVRDHLEDLVARDALEYASDDDIAELGAIVASMEHEGPEGMLPAVWSFHRRVGQMVNNRVLREMYTSLTDYIAASTKTGADALSQDPAAFANERLAVHRDIYRAIAARDRNALDEALLRHIG